MVGRRFPGRRNHSIPVAIGPAAIQVAVAVPLHAGIPAPGCSLLPRKPGKTEQYSSAFSPQSESHQTGANSKTLRSPQQPIVARGEIAPDPNSRCQSGIDQEITERAKSISESFQHHVRKPGLVRNGNSLCFFGNLLSPANGLKVLWPKFSTFL